MLIETSATSLVEVEEGVKVLPPNLIVATFDKIVNWGRLSSIWPTTFGLA
jgi:NADH-quinone oxidoreductase subunit B